MGPSLLPCLALVLSVAASGPVFTDSAIFERVSHFKDVGIPATLNDPFNRAAIADGSCRSVQPNGEAWSLDGYAFWHHPDRVDKVIAAMQELPSTRTPSNMTITARKPAFSHDACYASSDNKTTTNITSFPLSDIQNSMQAWFRALCQEDFADPAYQPQQMALTVGYMCAITCDSNQHYFHSTFYKTYTSTEGGTWGARQAVCDNMPGYEPDFFAQTRSLKDVAYAVGPIYHEPCGCTPEP